MSIISLLLLFYSLQPVLCYNTTNCNNSTSTRIDCPSTTVGTLGLPIPYCTYYYSRGCCVRNVPTNYSDPTPRYTTEYFCPPKIAVSVCGTYCIAMIAFVVLGTLCCVIGCIMGIVSLAIGVHLLTKNSTVNVYRIKKARDRQNRYSRTGGDEEREIILEEINPNVKTSCAQSKDTSLPIQDLENEKNYYQDAPSVLK